MYHYEFVTHSVMMPYTPLSIKLLETKHLLLGCQVVECCSRTNGHGVEFTTTQNLLLPTGCLNSANQRPVSWFSTNKNNLKWNMFKPTNKNLAFQAIDLFCLSHRDANRSNVIIDFLAIFIQNMLFCLPSSLSTPKLTKIRLAMYYSSISLKLYLI